MSVTITDATLLAQFRSGSTVEIKDETGHVIGQFVPTNAPKTGFPEFGVTVEELEQKMNNPNAKWYTPEQVMARLREIDQCTG
ncbi:MAG: hypothetical protein JNK93_10570 [Planctomycetia bacterium]|nr:hypothetical protein [Planctomycetia bacterium]